MYSWVKMTMGIERSKGELYLYLFQSSWGASMVCKYPTECRLHYACNWSVLWAMWKDHYAWSVLEGFILGNMSSKDDLYNFYLFLSIEIVELWFFELNASFLLFNWYLKKYFSYCFCSPSIVSIFPRGKIVLFTKEK